MDRKLPQGAELKVLYVGALRILIDDVATPVLPYNSQGHAADGQRLADQRYRLERLIESLAQLSPDHYLLNNPMLVPFVSVGDGDDTVWTVKDRRLLQAATAHDWQNAEDWLTVALHRYDYME